MAGAGKDRERQAIKTTHPPKVRAGYIEAIVNGKVIGWAIDPGRAGPASLFLFIDDRPVANFFCHVMRGDIESDAPSGFEIPLPVQFLDGETHVLRVRFDGGDVLLVAGEDGASDTASFRSIATPVLTSYVDGLSNGAIRGWAVLQHPGSSLKVGSLDLVVRSGGVELARITADRYRPDVASAIDGDAHCGFIYVPPPRYRNGQVHEFEILLAATGENLDDSPVMVEYPAYLTETKLARLYDAVDTISIQLWRLKRELKETLARTILPLDEYDDWARQYQPTLRHRLALFPLPPAATLPLVSIICPVYRPRADDFRAAIGSVLAQTYPNWELILVDDNGGSVETTGIIETACGADPRVRALPQKKNGGISGATNAAITAARGDYIALFDHDDLLEDVAVEVMMGAALQTGAKMLYSDEDKVDDYGRFSDPNLKSAWNYRLLLGQNYVCHFLVIRKDVLKAVGPLRKKYDGAQDHDLMLRLSEVVAPQDIVHVPEIIYHWRKTPGSTATRISAKSYAVHAGELAVQDHLLRRGLKATVRSMLDVTIYDIGWQFKATPSVTVVIPFRDQIELTRRCLDALIGTTRYPNYTVILVDNWSSGPEAAAFTKAVQSLKNVSVVQVKEPFNYSRLNNIACARSKADFFVFMNNDVFIEQPNWLSAMVNEALADPGVGAVGAKLVYPDRTVQHGGVILGVGGVGDHANRGRPFNDPFYVGRGLCAQEVSAVTGALMLCRATAFRQAGGFDEAELSVAYNDVDLCLKLRHHGYKIVYCPAVIAEHHESVSRGSDMGDAKLGRFLSEEQVMLARWPGEIANDPCYNPNFSNEGGIFNELSAAPLSQANPRPILGRRGQASRTGGDAPST